MAGTKSNAGNVLDCWVKPAWKAMVDDLGLVGKGHVSLGEGYQGSGHYRWSCGDYERLPSFRWRRWLAGMFLSFNRVA